MKYKKVKNGDYFHVKNYPHPTCFYKDGTDKSNRPTRLIDGNYLSINDDTYVQKITKEEALKLTAKYRNTIAF